MEKIFWNFDFLTYVQFKTTFGKKLGNLTPSGFVSFKRDILDLF